MTVSMQRIEVVLKLPTSVPSLLIRATAIVDAMTGNPAFPSPTPSLAKVGAAIDALRTALTTSMSGARGTNAARNDRRRVLVVLLQRLKAYVEGIAEESPEAAGSIIEGAGMNVKKRTNPVKPPFDVNPGPVHGSMKLTVKAAAKRASYEWQWREDGTTTWRSAPRTLQAKTVIRGLTPGTTVWFRYRVTVRGGVRDWSEAVSVIVR